MCAVPHAHDADSELVCLVYAEFHGAQTRDMSEARIGVEHGHCSGFVHDCWLRVRLNQPVLNPLDIRCEPCNSVGRLAASFRQDHAGGYNSGNLFAAPTESSIAVQ